MRLELSGSARIVAQICNLPYRRFAIGRLTVLESAVLIGRSAECNSAIQQIANLRYSSAVLTDRVNRTR